MDAFSRFSLVLALVLALGFGSNLWPLASAADDKIKDLLRANGTVEIKVIEAQVPDLDPLPMQKDSDTFVRVYLNASKELLCETQIVQDENKPKVSLCV